MTTNGINIASFAQYVADSAQELAEINDVDINTELTKYYVGCLEECGEVSAPEICMFSEGRAKLSAYDYNDEAETLDLFLFIHASSLMQRVDARIETGFNYLQEFYNQCLKKKAPFKGGEKAFPAEVQDAINLVRESKGKVNVIRFYILTDGFVSSTQNKSSEIDEEGLSHEYNIWDIARIFLITVSLRNARPIHWTLTLF